MVWWDMSLPISEQKYDQTLSTCLISQDRLEPGYFWAMVKTVFLIFSLKGDAHPPKKKNNKIQIHLLGIRIRRNPIHHGGMTRGPICQWFLTVAHWPHRRGGGCEYRHPFNQWHLGLTYYPRENEYRPCAPCVDDFPGENHGFFSHLC